MERTKINKVEVTGTLSEVDTQVRTTSDGRNYINGKIVVKVMQGDTESLVELKVLAFEKTKTGAINKLYTAYTGLEGMLFKRVRLTGELRENNFVRQDGTLQKFNEIALKFVSLAKDADPDCATFSYSGFVTKSIYERRNKNDELLGYRLEVAQQNYNGTSIQVIRFDIDAQDTNIQTAVDTFYTVGATVEFSGIISYLVSTETRTEEQAFGDPIVRTFTRSEKMFRITSGKEAFSEDDPATYTNEEIRTLVEAYKAADADRIAKAKSATEAPAPTSGIAGMTKSKVTSLI